MLLTHKLYFKKTKNKRNIKWKRKRKKKNRGPLRYTEVVPLAPPLQKLHSKKDFMLWSASIQQESNTVLKARHQKSRRPTTSKQSPLHKNTRFTVVRQECLHPRGGREKLYWKQRRKYKSYKNISLLQLSIVKIWISLEFLTHPKATPNEFI